jgi:arabinogalactan oligomer / maltooligosaccharide transport system substrate-binding protein
MHRGHWLRLPALAISFLLVAMAMSGLSTARAQDDLKGELTLWHGWTGAEADTLNNDVLPAWQAAHPNVKITTLAVPFDQLKNKYQTEAATGGGPDLLIGPIDWIGELSTAELIHPLDEMADETLLSNYIPATVDALRYDGKLYALPESFETVALFYNKTKVPEPPKTTADMEAISAQIATGGADTYGLALRAGFYHTAGFLFGFGGKLFTNTSAATPGSEASPVTSALNSPETVAYLTWLKDLAAKPGIWAKDDDNAMTSLFKEGKAAMVVNGPWFTADAANAIGKENLGVVPLPAISEASGAAPMPFLGVKNIMINANADEDQAKLAFEFAKWFTGPDAETFLANKAGHLPAHTGVDVSGDPVAVSFVEQAKSATPLPTIPEMGQVWTPAGDMITKVLAGDATPEQAAAEAAEAIDKAIETSGT